VACGLTVLFRFGYRADAQEEWSQQYWFTGGTPADATAWNALRAALVVGIRPCLPSTVQHIGSYGYDSEDDGATAVYSDDYRATPVAGTLTTTGGTICPGDSAVWLRWKTSRLNSNGKPIYLRKYFHPAVATTGTPDDVLAAQNTALDALGTLLVDGSFIGARKITARGHTDVITNHSSSVWVTTRTLKRRGKRPGS
jgi:hypothetical protein